VTYPSRARLERPRVRAREHQGGNEQHGGYEFDGWYTLAWSRAHGDWKLVLWTWRIAGAVRVGQLQDTP
jgi:hypothetical protein